MHILFIHRAFPAQFGRLAQELTQRYGWKCSFVVEHLSRCPSPTPEMLRALSPSLVPLPAVPRETPPWPQRYGQLLDVSQALFAVVRQRPDLRPDLVVGHGGLVPTLLLRELLDCPIVDYCEYYFAPERSDLTYRVDLPLAEPAPFFPRCINAATLVNLVAADAGYAPTHWQRQTFPPRFQPKIAVHFDGIDTDLYRPRPLPRVLAGNSIGPETRVVTFVARGLEAMRGFDIFMEVAGRILRERPNVLFVIVGGEETYYGWDRLQTGTASFKEWVLSRGEYDLSRFAFLGQLEPEQLAEILRLSDLHLYLTVPFALSWSLFNALAAGCVVLASDVPPVCEVIEPGKNGLVAPLFDREMLAETALRVLEDPAAYRPLGQAARAGMLERYSLEVAVPGLRDFFEGAASGRETKTGACDPGPAGVV
jgi:glycosyltransferase involved in cell wall biosynthesis